MVSASRWIPQSGIRLIPGALVGRQAGAATQVVNVEVDELLPFCNGEIAAGTVAYSRGPGLAVEVP